MEKRIIALDIGDKRIGLAISDPFNDYAMPVDTYHRTGNFAADIRAMAQFARSREAGTIVCGLPVNADGSASIQTEKTRRFIDALQAETDLPVLTEDERFTSIQAHEVLHEEGFRAKKHKKNVDSIAASYILETYLSRRKNKKQTEGF